MTSAAIFFRRTMFVLLIICSTLPAGVSYSQNLNDELPTDPDLCKGTLPNGLTYYIRHNNTPEHKVELRLVVKAGSILEDDDQQGLAHFMEHMNFNGTKNFPKNELVNYFETIGMKFGADLNANTGFNRTVYILSIPTDRPDNISKGFQVLEDWAHNALLTDQDIDEERGVVLEESRLRKGADERLQEQYYPKLFSGARYCQRWPIGKDSIIKNVSHDALRRFYHDWYRPDLMAVIVIGDIDTANAVKLIQEHFAPLTNPKNERAHFYAPIPDRTAPECMVLKDKEEVRTTVFLSYPFTANKEEHTINDYREHLKENILLQLLRSRLRDRYVGGQQVSNVYFNTAAYGYRSFMLSIGFPASGPEQNIKGATYVLKQAASYGFYQSEIEMIEEKMMSANNKHYNERNKEMSIGYINEYIRNFTENEPIEGSENENRLYKQLLPTIKNYELIVLLREWMAGENTFTYLIAPDDRKYGIPSNKELGNMIKSGLQQPTVAQKEKILAASLIDKTLVAGKIADRKYDARLDATTYTLDNGIQVTLKITDFKNDEIKLSGIKKGGKCNYNDDDRINCHFADKLTPMMGYGKFSPGDLSKQLSGSEVSVQVRMDETTDEVTGSSTVHDAETMFQLLYLKLTSPRKDDETYTKWKENYKKNIDHIYANPEAYFADTFSTVLYNDNPLYVGLTASEDLKSLRLKEMLDIYTNEFSYADGYHFFITGNIDTLAMLPLLETYLGSLPVSGNKAVCRDNGLRPITGKNKFTVHKGKENKSYIIAVYYGDLAMNEEMERNMKAMTDILNIKVLQHLREKMSDIYTGGFSSASVSAPYHHYVITLTLPCGPEHVDELLGAADKEIKAIKENGPTEQDLQKVKAQLYEKYLLNIKDNAYWNAQLRRILFAGKNQDNVLNYKSFIDKMTIEDIQKTAQQLFDGKNELTGILMPE